MNTKLSPEEQYRIREVRETIGTLIASPGFRMFYTVCFKPTIDKIKWTLLWDASLPSDERAAQNLALRGYSAGFEAAYRNAGISPPEWIKQELDIK